MSSFCSRCSNIFYVLMTYTILLTAAMNTDQRGINPCSTFSTITYDPTTTFTFGSGQGCFVLHPLLSSQRAPATSPIALPIVRRCPNSAVDGPLVDNDPCHEHNSNHSSFPVTNTTSVLRGLSLTAVTASATHYLPATTQFIVPVFDGKAEYICTLGVGNSSTLTSIPAPKAAFTAPLTSSSYPAAQDADQINSSSVVPSTRDIGPFGAGIDAPLSAEGSAAVTTIGRSVTQAVQIQVVSTIGTADLQTSSFMQLDPEAPVSVPGPISSQNIGQLIAAPFQTTTIPEESAMGAPMSIDESLPIQTTEASEIFSAGKATPLIQTASNLVVLNSSSPPTETARPTNLTEISRIGISAPLMDQFLTLTSPPTSIFPPSSPPTISIFTQYQTVTVTYTPTSMSSPTMNPNTTFQLSMVKIAPAAASTTAAPSSKSEGCKRWTGWHFYIFALFVGLLVPVFDAWSVRLLHFAEILTREY